MLNVNARYNNSKIVHDVDGRKMYVVFYVSGITFIIILESGGFRFPNKMNTTNGTCGVLLYWGLLCKFFFMYPGKEYLQIM